MKKITFLLLVLMSTLSFSQGGDCSNPIVIGALPYNTSDNTANYGDDYENGSSPCSSYYMSGDDVFYTYTPVSNENINVTLSGISGTYSGIHILDGCVDTTPNCVAFEGNSGSGDRVLTNIALSSGVTYYIVISTWASPQSITYTLDVSLSPTDTPDWYNIQWLSDGVNGSNTSLTVDAWTTITGYAQVYEDGVTNPAGEAAGFECWFGAQETDSDPSTWAEGDWISATYLGDVGNND
ncbi:MAG: hypothetical protein HKO92_01480 [Flavobacteriaceae bacterium]|nr:hypothetical protein [Flavobacteriaceae bacterium]